MNRRPLPKVPASNENISANLYESPVHYEKPKKKGKITKRDIGAPRDFRHEAHFGFDGQKFGMVDEIQGFLSKVGITDKQLKNKETKIFVEDFIRKNNVHDVVYRESMQVTRNAPPIPSNPPPDLPNRPKNKNVNMRNRPVPPIPKAPAQVKSGNSNAPPVSCILNHFNFLKSSLSAPTTSNLINGTPTPTSK
jgi:hypothetical protein